MYQVIELLWKFSLVGSHLCLVLWVANIVGVGKGLTQLLVSTSLVNYHIGIHPLRDEVESTIAVIFQDYISV